MQPSVLILSKKYSMCMFMHIDEESFNFYQRWAEVVLSLSFLRKEESNRKEP